MAAGSNISRATAGFMTFTLSLIGLAIYIFWSLLPDWALQKVGFSYYPNRYWAVAAPSVFGVILAYFLFFNFVSYMRNTKPLEDLYNLTDEQSKEAAVDTNPLGHTVANSSVRPLTDLPVSMTSLVLHQAWPSDVAE